MVRRADKKGGSTMTVKELMEKTPVCVTIVDNNSRCELTPWNIFYNAFKDCVIDTVSPTATQDLEITLKTQLVKKEG
jgi:hypothetical protein